MFEWTHLVKHLLNLEGFSQVSNDLWIVFFEIFAQAFERLDEFESSSW